MVDNKNKTDNHVPYEIDLAVSIGYSESKLDPTTAQLVYLPKFKMINIHIDKDVNINVSNIKKLLATSGEKLPQEFDVIAWNIEDNNKGRNL